MFLCGGSDAFIILADRFAAVFALQPADDEMTFREALKMLAEEHVERETADCARDRNQFCGYFLTNLKTKSCSDPADK